MPPKCVFERLLICHYQLVERCINGGLDEGASLEELSEEILYYHVDTVVGGRRMNAVAQEPGETSQHATSDAVQFAGLCSALLSLPSALNVGSDEPAEDDDETKHVHLDTCTLVFVPLESQYHKGIMAIAQVERSASPLAVRKSIEQCHERFCLLRGGIHYHLSQEFSSLNSAMDAVEKSRQRNPVQSVIMNLLQQNKQHDQQPTELYPGMKDFYALRKQIRRQRRELSRLNHDDENQQERQELIASIAALDDRIQSLAVTLPITSLRKLLKTHYEEYIADIGLASIETGMLHKCLVDNVPAPIVKPTEPLMRQNVHKLPTSTVTESLEKEIRNLLETSVQNVDANDPVVVGICAFFNGQYMFYEQTSADDDMPLLVSPQTAHLLMEYMSCYRAKVSLHAQQHSGHQSTKTPPRRIGSGLRRLLSASLIDEDTIVTVDADESSIIHYEDDQAQFLVPPPLSMLNVSDQVIQVELPSHGKAWTPQVYLPMMDASKDNESVSAETLEANLVLLDVGDYSFLLFVKPGTPTNASADQRNATAASPQSVSLESNEEATPDENRISSEQGLGMASSAIITIPTYSRLLEMAATHLVNAVSTTHDLEQEDTSEDGNKHEHESHLAESGQHVAFVDRSTRRIVLFSDGQRHKKASSGGSMSSTRSVQSLVDGATGIDCRHILASHLPPNAVAAFDDLMNQVHERTNCPDNEAVLELCTYMREGWAYAHAQDQKELYIFFDASKFVTVSDVTKAAERVRIELFE